MIGQSAARPHLLLAEKGNFLAKTVRGVAQRQNGQNEVAELPFQTCHDTF